VLALLLASPAAARGNATPGIYPGTLKDVCVGDTIFIGETGLNLTPLTPYASGTVESLYPDESLTHGKEIKVDKAEDSRNFYLDSNKVKEYPGIYYPKVGGSVLKAYPIHISANNDKYPYSVEISGKEWMIADGSDSTTLIVRVKNKGGSTLSGVKIALAVSSPWTLTESDLLTDNNGEARTTLSPTTKSGSAVITASASVPGVTTAPVTTTSVQKIDAATPAKATALYTSTATVGSLVNISVLVEDRYGNPVTSARTLKNVSFYSGSGGTGTFLDGQGNRVKAINAALNATGYVGVSFHLNTLQGDNLILIIPPSPLSFQIIDIMGVGNSKPFKIMQVTEPPGNPPYIPANDESKATIHYFLYDEWGNPSIDQAVNITTDAGERRIFITNEDGRVTVLYGPKREAAFYTLTATAVENPVVNISQTLQFGSMKPDDMLLTASPQTMASLDVPVPKGKERVAPQVFGKVIDARGNPVKGQTVRFTIEKDSAPYNQTSPPVIGSPGIGSTSGIGVPIDVFSDVNGHAILEYTPGAFATSNEPGYSDKASGTTTITATWKGPEGTVTRSIDLSYKNYPYLSVYTEVSPKTVQVGNKVKVSVRLKGDGWAMQVKPIDVVLCTDRSGTMLINESIDANGNLVVESLNDRMVDAMNAGRAFVDKTNEGQDRVGLITFGSPYKQNQPYAILLPNATYGVDQSAWHAGKDYACTEAGQPCDGSPDMADKTVFITTTYPAHGLGGRNYWPNGVWPFTYNESSLTYDKELVKAAIGNIVPAGGTPMRRGLYESVKQLLNNPREGAVRAVILLTDGSWNVGGDPTGKDTSAWQPDNYLEIGKRSVIDWARENDIRIYTIAIVGKDPTAKDLPNLAQLQGYADDTGGTFHKADDSTQLEGIYKEIAGELREEASVNTQLSLNFNNMEVYGPEGVHEYEGKEVFQYKRITGQSTRVTFPTNGTGYDVDNTDDWKTGTFSFDQGTIKVNEE
ncbi:MAG: VWA domain-containing protein, partial [Methanomicrobiales archaeon]|nr:VWA domain-containing protein [Methanomicrobiales archaeon]